MWLHWSQLTKSSSADALDWLRRVAVAIGNDPLVSKAAAAAERPIHCPEAAGKVHCALPLRSFKSACRESLLTGGSEEMA